MTKLSARPLLTALIACCGALGALAPSQAAVIVLNYDPLYGEPFQQLRWQVTADLYVPSGCEATGSFQPGTFVGSTNPCGLSRVDNVRLYFFDNSPSPNDPRVIVNRLDIGTYGAVSGVTSTGETQALFSVTPTPLSALGYAFQTSWSTRLPGDSSVVKGDFDFSLRLSLLFDSAGGLLPSLAQLVHLNSNDDTPQERFSADKKSAGPVLTLAQRFAGDDGAYVPRRAGEIGGYLDSSGAGIAQVPEPGSIALVLAALLAAGVARRRRA